MGRRVAGRRVRDVPAAPVLPGHPRASSPTRPASTARTRGRSSAAIYLPLARPALATLAIFTFMWTWNDLLNPLIYLQHLDQYTTTVGLAFFQGQYVGKWPEMMAGALVSLAPMIMLFVARPAVLRARHRAQRASRAERRSAAAIGLALEDFRPRQELRVPATDGAAAALPGDRRPQPPRARRSAATGRRGRPRELEAALDASGVEAIVDLDGGWGDHLRARDRALAGAAARAGSPCSRAWTTRAGPRTRRSARRRRARLRDGVAAGARGLKVWKLLGLRARDPRGTLVAGRRPAPGPAVGGGRRARRPGHDPRRRPDRLLRARSTRATSAGRSSASTRTGTSGRRGPPGRPGPRRVPAVRRAHRRPRGGRRPPPGDDVHRRPRRLRRRGPRAGVGDPRALPELQRGPRGADRASSGRQPYTARAFIERWSDRVLFGTDMAPGPGVVGRLLPVPRDRRRVVRLRRRRGRAARARAAGGSTGSTCPTTSLRRVYRENALR